MIKRVIRGLIALFFTLLFAGILLVIASVYFYKDGIPFISNYAVNKTPLTVDDEVGIKVRDLLLQTEKQDTVCSRQLTDFFAALGYDTSIQIYVIQDGQFNAFALPGKYIFVHNEVLKNIRSYPELAALLGHEYIHIKNRHSMKMLAHEMTRELLTNTLTGEDNADDFIRKANFRLLMKSSRAYETEADKGALALLSAHHIDLTGMRSLMQFIVELEARYKNDSPVYLSSHPEAKDRLSLIENEINTSSNDYHTDSRLKDLFDSLVKKYNVNYPTNN